MNKPGGGEIFYRDTQISKETEKELTHLRASQFGFVFQRTHLIGNLTVSENIRMAGLTGALNRVLYLDDGRITGELSLSNYAGKGAGKTYTVDMYNSAAVNTMLGYLTGNVNWHRLFL